MPLAEGALSASPIGDEPAAEAAAVAAARPVAGDARRGLLERAHQLRRELADARRDVQSSQREMSRLQKMTPRLVASCMRARRDFVRLLDEQNAIIDQLDESIGALGRGASAARERRELRAQRAHAACSRDSMAGRIAEIDVKISSLIHDGDIRARNGVG